MRLTSERFSLDSVVKDCCCCVMGVVEAKGIGECALGGLLKGLGEVAQLL